MGRVRVQVRRGAVRRAAAVLAAGLCLAGSAGVAPAGTARAADGRAPVRWHYVALGDSYTAGPLVTPPAGRPVVRTDPIGCVRSWNDYPAFLADWLDVGSYTDVSCSGAQVADLFAPQGGDRPLAAPQLDALDATTDLVTLGIGGNDHGLFGSLIDTCGALHAAHPHADAPCQAHFTSAGVDTKSRDARHVRGRVARAVAAVRAAAPAAAVYVVGYPRLLPPGARTCDAVGFAAGDVAWGNHVEHVLNRSLRAAAAEQGARFVNLYPATRGHHACAGDAAYVNGAQVVLSGPHAGASFHPTRDGERAMAAAVYRRVTGATAPTTVDAAPPADAVVPNPAYPG